MKKKSTNILSNKSAAAIKAELAKYSETFNVKETQKLVEEVVKKVTEEYELKKSDLVPDQGDEAPTWYNKLAGLLDKFRVIPRLVMLAYIFAFYTSVKWFMGLTDPTNAQAMFISTIVGAGAAFFGLYVGKPGASLPKSKK